MNNQGIGGVLSHKKDSMISGPPGKRQKLRRGTTSCWECKHRKKRCEYGLGSPSTCDLCLRFDLQCVSQELPDSTEHRNAKSCRRIVHIEALVEELLRQRNQQLTHALSGTPPTQRQKSVRTNHSDLSTLKSISHERLSRGRSLTAYLESFFPDPAIAGVILGSRQLFSSPFQDDHTPRDHLEIKHPNRDPIITQGSHPLQLAKGLLQLAMCLKQFDIPSSRQLEQHLEDSVSNVAQRFFNAATHFVLSQDYLVASLEGIEVLIFQSRWYSTIGDFRKACAIHHRAIRIALSIDILKLIETNSCAEQVWFHLVYGDRFLSLMLGVPFADANDSFTHPSRLAMSSPNQNLERTHTFLVGKIISRNLRIQRAMTDEQRGTMIMEEYKETACIDDQMKKAARIMPISWWQTPSLTNVGSGAEVLQITRDILLQMHQYYLLVVLHQPYIVPKKNWQSDGIDHTYSKFAATSACRAMLSRYIVARNYHRSPSYQALDEKAFIACVTLILAHLTGHGSGNANILEHQRPQDLCIIGESVQLLDQLAKFTGNLHCDSHSRMLKQFMKIEEDAANGSVYKISSEQKISDNEIETDGKSVQFRIPYFGILSVAPSELAGFSGSLDGAHYASSRSTPQNSGLQFTPREDTLPEKDSGILSLEE